MTKVGELKITEGMVTKLLAKRHTNDVFVAGCKNGPTRTANAKVLIMDAWVMPKSWAHPGTTGYEIKCARGDFLRDEKWMNYLPLCNYFYFVAPKDVISKDEVPSNVGLLEVSKNAKMVITRKKAPFREIEDPIQLFRYVLMCRTRIASDSFAQLDRREEYRAYVADKSDRRSVGYDARRKIATAVDTEVGEIRDRNRHLEEKIGLYEIVAEVMAEAGIDSTSSWRLRQQSRQIMIDDATSMPLQAMKFLKVELDKALDIMEGEGDEEV